MTCYADSCLAPPSWNDWQKVAHRVATRFDEAMENRGQTGWFSAVRTETMNKRFGFGWKAKAFRSAVRPESKEDVEAALRRDGPTAASARGVSAESGPRERGRAQGRSGAPSRGVSRESRQSQREASSSRASSRAGAISPELNDIWTIGEEGSQERREPSPAAPRAVPLSLMRGPLSAAVDAFQPPVSEGDDRSETSSVYEHRVGAICAEMTRVGGTDAECGFAMMVQPYLRKLTHEYKAFRASAPESPLTL